MHSSNLLVLFAAAVTAQSTVEVLNLYSDDKTLVFKGSDKTATTYENICKATSHAASGKASSTSLAKISSSFGEASPLSSATPTATPSDLDLVPITPSSAEDAPSDGPSTPSPTAQDLNLVPIVTEPARLRRRQSPNNDTADCEPYTIIQGSSSWQFHLSDDVPGAMTINANCHWSGALASASLTCTATREGSAFQDPGESTTVLRPSEVASASAIVTAVIVTTTDSPSGSPSASGNGTSNATFSRTPTASHTDLATLSGSGAPSSSSTGMAAALALPTGAAAFVGGAAGVLAAVFAL